jgi:hypothetical protein
MKVFRKKYEAWRYFGNNPKPIFGLLAMIVQGIVLSYVYGIFNVNHESIIAGLLYALVMGLFFWSYHFLSYMAKHNESRNINFLSLKSVYLGFQFGIFGIAISIIHRVI